MAACAALCAGAPSAAAETTELSLRYGPIQVDGYATVAKTKPVPAPRVDGYITGMHARVVDAAGRPISVKRIMLHHVLFLNQAVKDETYCPGNSERFYGTGEENQRLRLPAGYGYEVKRDHTWKMNFMLMNHKLRGGRAFIEYRVTIEDSPETIPLRPIWLGVMPCLRDPIFNVPGGAGRGSTYVESRTWTAPRDGRLVAAAGHAHGGLKSLDISQPRCGDRKLLSSTPTYGHPDNVVYNVLPVLHEPGPIDMSWWHSATGIPVRQGEALKVSALYDGELPHSRTMGIMHAYFAPAAPGSGFEPACPRLPADAQQVDEGRDGVALPPRFKVPLIGLDRRGRPKPISRPPGRLVRRDRGMTLPVRGFDFGLRNLSIPMGAALTWRFMGRQLHNVTLANGPEGFGSQPLNRGARYRQRFTRPGTYRLFCTLHPIGMTQRVVVRRSG